MKNNAYVLIDAHIIRCRLHHVNSLLYSVGLKSGKDQLIATQFKPSKDLIIDMNSHLTLNADKHSYDQFPKLTLTINVMNENKERKTVGTTFVNFRKQGIQTFQVSECSCKDKAFQVDICFITKIIEAKSSNAKTQKNQIRPQTKNNFLTQQNTPRQSKVTIPDIEFKGVKQINPVSAAETRDKLRQVKSQKAIKPNKPEMNTEKKSKKDKQNLEQEIAVLNQKILSFEKQVYDLKQSKFLLQKQRIKCQKWLQLFKLQQQKNGEAMRYIIQLEEIIVGMMSKDTTKSKNDNYKEINIIQQKDEIIMMNEELQSELFKQKQKMKQMQSQINQLKLYLQTMELKLKDEVDKQDKKPQIPHNIDHSTILHLKSDIYNQKILPQEIMITSRVKNIQDIPPNPEILQNKKKQLMTQIQSLQSKIYGLKQQVDKLLLTKQNLEKQIAKPRLQNKKVIIPPNKLPPKREELSKKNQKGNSKQKSPKPASVKTTKKAATGLITPSPPVQLPNKKTTQISNCETKTEKRTKVSTELQCKTEKQESLSKCSQLIFNEVKSDNIPQPINQVIFHAKTFQDQITYF